MPTQSATKNQIGPCPGYINNPIVASQTLVLHSTGPHSGISNLTPAAPEYDLPKPQLAAPPEPGAPWLNPSKQLRANLSGLTK